MRSNAPTGAGILVVDEVEDWSKITPGCADAGAFFILRFYGNGFLRAVRTLGTI